MTPKKAPLLIAPILLFLIAAADETDGPHYTSEGALILPAEYRDWIFLSAGLDMSYSDAPAMTGHSMFDNVFVDRASWQRFKETGHWPDRTVLVMEQRGATTRGSINKRGKYQNGDLMAIEIHVRDESRFKGGWAFFSTDGGSNALQIPYTADCYSCHLQHGAVDTTFVQFYPTAKSISEKAGTFRIQ